MTAGRTASPTLFAVVFVIAMAFAPVVTAQHGGGCACGRHQLAHPTWQLDLVTSSWRAAAVPELEKWHSQVDAFGWSTTGDDVAGINGQNEIVWFGITNTFLAYGISIDSNVFGVTFLTPLSAFGNPPFNGCPPPSNVTCGLFTETDVVMNADFGRGWTTAAPNFNDTGPANFGATALHELGHALGLHHNFDNLSTMNYFEDFATLYMARADASIARLHHPSAAQNRTDLAVYPFRYTGIGSGYSSTVVASPDRSTVQAGQSFVLRDFTIENIGSSSLSNVRYELYLSSNTTITTSDHFLGGLQWSTFTTWWDTAGQTFTVPTSVPSGTYYIGALVFYNSNQQDGITYNNSWVLDASRRITVGTAAASDLVVVNPSVNDSSLSPGQAFTVSATVRNDGSASSPSTNLRYYRSSNSTISSADTLLGSDFVTALSPGGTSPESESFSAPSTAGTYYVGACVEAVSGESNTGNNCSSGVPIVVSSGASCGTVQISSTTLSGSSLHGACDTLFAGPALVVAGSATLEAGRVVVFRDGFRVSSGGTLVARSCGRSFCTAGEALPASCHSCVSKVCAADNFCCAVNWDSLCVETVASECGVVCP